MAMTTTQAFAYTQPLPTALRPKANLFARFLAALKASREAQARREIARHAALIDGLTRNNAIGRNDLPF